MFNPEKTEKDGDFLVINHGNKIECNMWIRPGSYNKSETKSDEMWSLSNLGL